MSTKIEWCDETWNPITGCTPISEGCKNCYAKRMANRLRGRFGYPDITPFYPTFHLDKVEQPMKWKKPRKIFVCSMGDLFHENYPEEWRTLVWCYVTLGAMKGHTMMILTKRPHIMKKFFEKHHLKLKYHKNVWLGVTTENQKTADERIPILLQIDAPVRFVSVEPMLGPVDLCVGDPTGRGPDWIVCGGETGTGARPMKEEWATDLLEQCKGANIPFFFKKWGAEIPEGHGYYDPEEDIYHDHERMIYCKYYQEFPEVS